MLWIVLSLLCTHIYFYEINRLLFHILINLYYCQMKWNKTLMMHCTESTSTDGTRGQTETNILPLSEILRSLGIMGDQLRAPLNPLNKIVLWWGGINWAPMMPRDTTLSNSYKSDRCCFTSLDETNPFHIHGRSCLLYYSWYWKLRRCCRTAAEFIQRLYLLYCLSWVRACTLGKVF